MHSLRGRATGMYLVDHLNDGGNIVVRKWSVGFLGRRLHEHNRLLDRETPSAWRRHARWPLAIEYPGENARAFFPPTAALHQACPLHHKVARRESEYNRVMSAPVSHSRFARMATGQA